jgi:hypothetical protein
MHDFSGVHNQAMRTIRTDRMRTIPATQLIEYRRLAIKMLNGTVVVKTLR